jgi:hypothetical protein
MSDHTELMRLTQDLLKKEGYSQNEWEEFHEAANPDAILALLIERKAMQAALAYARQEAINAKGIAGMCVKALTQAEGFVSATNRKAWGSDEGIGSTLPMIRDTLQRAKIFGKGNPQ